MNDVRIDLAGCTINLHQGTILRRGLPVCIEPRAWRVLELLARFRHRVVTKNELLRALRPDGGATEGALKQAIRLARMAIGDSGAGTIIRSIPRVGYRFDAGPLGHVVPTEEAPPQEAPLRILARPLVDLTGQPHLHWAGIGAMGSIAHGLSRDRRLLLMHDPQCLDLDTAQPRSPRELEQVLRATGADWVLSGTLTSQDGNLRLEIQMRCADRHAVVSVTSATTARLISLAIERLHREIVPTPDRQPFDGGLRECSFISIETFARAMHAAAQNRDAAALRLLQLLEQFDPRFPGLELELLRAHAACGSPEGEEIAQRLLAAAHDANDTALEAQTLLAAGRLCATSGRFRDAEQHLRGALRVGGPTMASDWVGQVLLLLASTLCHLGEMDAVEEHLANAQAVCAATGNRYLSLNVLWLRAALSSQTGDLERAIHWHKRLASTARRLRAPRALTAACINLTGDHIQLYRLDEACRYAEEATAAALTMENDVYLALVANVYCLLLRLQERPEAAAALLGRLPKPRPDDPEGHLWQAHGHAAAAAGRLDDAADCFTMAAQVYRAQRNCLGEVHLVPWLVEALVRSGRLGQADAELARAAEQAHLQDDWTTAHLLYGRALLAKARHAHAECAELLARLQKSTAAKPLFRELARQLARVPRQRISPSETSMHARRGLLRREYRFGPYLIDLDRRIFWVNGRRQRLAPMPFDVLAYLCRNPMRVVSQAELLSALWPDEGGSPETVAQAIASIRRAARTGAPSPGLIETVYGRGYKLLSQPAAAPEAEDEDARSLITLASGPDLPLLIVMPASGAAAGEPTAAAPRDDVLLLGQSMSIHANMHLLLPEPSRDPDAGSGSEPGDGHPLAALQKQHPSACVVQVAMSRRDGHARIEYDARYAQQRDSGTMQHRSVTALGRALALHLLHKFCPDASTHRVASMPDAWSLQWLDRAALAFEQQNWRRALSILDVVTDEDPGNQHAASLRELAARAIQQAAGPAPARAARAA